MYYSGYQFELHPRPRAKNIQHELGIFFVFYVHIVVFYY